MDYPKAMCEKFGVKPSGDDTSEHASPVICIYF